MKRATLQAPRCAAPLRSTNVTYTICTDPSGEFHTCHGSCGLVWGGRLSVWNELKRRVGVLWLELNAVHILNCRVDDWKMRTSRWNLNLLACCCHIPGVFSFVKISSSVSTPPNSLVLSPQPAIIARSPGPFLRSAGSRLRPGRPAVVYFNSSGETDPGEPPHPSPPGQGCLHGQTLSGGRRGRRGRHGSRRSRITVSAAGARMTSGSAPRLSLASHPP